MKLIRMTEDGTYWLQAQSMSDEIALRDFARDALADTRNGKPHTIKFVNYTIGSGSGHIQLDMK